MYWLGIANGSLSKLKEQHVGTEVVKAVDYKQLHRIGDLESDTKIEKIFKLDQRRAFKEKERRQGRTVQSAVSTLNRTTGKYCTVEAFEKGCGEDRDAFTGKDVKGIIQAVSR